MDDELDIPPTEDDAAFIWLTSAVQDVLSTEQSRPEASAETVAPDTSK